VRGAIRESGVNLGGGGGDEEKCARQNLLMKPAFKTPGQAEGVAGVRGGGKGGVKKQWGGCVAN